jgi:radical SAM protein with 4Fe4S-binding SPASM domain
MTEEIALQTVQYIKNHCGGDKVHISWFGGEPLYNRAAIDTICDGLNQAGVEFSSNMVSNGYLFDAEIIKTAVDAWNLKRVQITLDGTEQVYNKTKAFIYKNENAYQRVLMNVGQLLDAGIAVQIRLNMDLYNAENLLELVQELANRFAGKNGLRVYAHHIFDGDKPMADMHTEEEWEKRDVAMLRLQQRIEESGLAGKRGISANVRLNYCMADSGRAVTILPGGEIGLCEHFSESEFIGHIDREGFDQAVVDSWKERIPEIPECATCFYYPQCRQLKKCPNRSVCFELIRREQRRKVERQMLNEYEKWKRQEISQEEPEGIDC